MIQVFYYSFQGLHDGDDRALRCDPTCPAVEVKGPNQKVLHMSRKFEALHEQAARVRLKVNATKIKDDVSCAGRDPGKGNGVHIS